MNVVDAIIIARMEFQKHGLEEWQLKITNAKQQLGCCKYAKKQICLSRPYIERAEESLVLDTIRHEIAHALTPGSGHGVEWKRKCMEIGCSPTRQKTLPFEIPSKYVGVCPLCGAKESFNRMPKRRYSCAKCAVSRRFDSRRELKVIPTEDQ